MAARACCAAAGVFRVDFSGLLCGCYGVQHRVLWVVAYWPKSKDFTLNPLSGRGVESGGVAGL